MEGSQQSSVREGIFLSSQLLRSCRDGGIEVLISPSERIHSCSIERSYAKAGIRGYAQINKPTHYTNWLNYTAALIG